MNIVNKTQLEMDLDSIQKQTTRTARRITTAARALNASHSVLWGLPDDRLQAVLQELVDTGQIQSVFDAHLLAANSLNAVLETMGTPNIKCAAVAGREFTISEGGIVEVVPIPEVEIESDPE